MARWEDKILGKVRKSDWLAIGNVVPTRQSDPIDSLFGDDKTDNIVAKWESIATEYSIPVMAQFHGFDTESKTTFRVPIDTHNIEKGLIKVKINQSERLRELNRSGVTDDDALYNYVMDDGLRLADQVITRTKVAKNELMATGKVTIKENDLDLTVDYGVPADNTQFAISFDDDADVSAQIQTIIDAALAKGVIINGMLTSKANLSKMRQHRSIQLAINGNIGVGALVSMNALNAYLSDEFGINRVVVNDLTYGASSVIDPSTGRPIISTKRYYPADKITFFGTSQSGVLGTGLWGNPPEVDAAKFYSVGSSSISPYVYIMQWMETDPAVLWTKASSLFIPVLYNPNSLFIATVDADSLPDVTVKPDDQSATQYGVSVANIQTADTAVLGNKEMSGKSKWLAAGNAITDVWGAGNFLAVKFESADWSRYTSVKVGLDPTAGSGSAELIGEDDKRAVFKVADPANQKLKIVATDGLHTDTQTISLSGVTLQSAGA